MSNRLTEIYDEYKWCLHHISWILIAVAMFMASTMASFWSVATLYGLFFLFIVLVLLRAAARCGR